MSVTKHRERISSIKNLATFKDICSFIASEEKGRSEVSIGNVREIMKIVSIMVYENPEILRTLLTNGKKHSRG